MSITIAGRLVKQGDPLYHTAFQAWGTVVGFDGGSAKLQLAGANGQTRILYVQQGGRVNGVRTVYWHEPLQLDLPQQDVTKYQRLLDNLVAEIQP